MLLNKVIYSFRIIKHEGHFLLDSGCQATVLLCIGFALFRIDYHCELNIKLLKNWSRALENKHRRAKFLTDVKLKCFIIFSSDKRVNLGTWRSKDYFSRNEKGFSSMWRQDGRRRIISVPLLKNCFGLIPNSPHISESRFRNPGILSGGIRNRGPWNPKYSSRNPEFH